MITHKKGIWGENRATRHLLEKGYIILKRNFRTERAEVDIIAREGDSLILVEVKNWDYASEEDLERVLNVAKQRRMKQAALIYQHQS